MAQPKRKRPHDNKEEVSEPSMGHGAGTATTRRATRQNPAAPDVSVPGAASNDGNQRRSGRIRGSGHEDPPEPVVSPPRLPAANRGTLKNGLDVETTSTATRPAVKDVSKPTRTAKRAGADPPKKGNKNTRKSSASGAQTKLTAESKVNKNAISKTKPSAAQKSRTSSPPASQQQQQLPRSPLVAHGTPQLPSRSSVLRTSNPPSASISTPKRPHAPDHKQHTPKPPPTPRSDRNIDKVVLGNISFRAWYPSYYGKEVLGDASGNAGAKDHHNNHAKIGGGKREPPLLPMLYVCPCCFKYSKEPVMWREHVKFCERRAHVPGTKVYTHPGNMPNPNLTEPSDCSRTTATSKARRKGGGGGGGENHVPVLRNPSTTKTFQQGGEWSVWEVDGEKEGLFCQNLSLFAKLFLDNKSVFFDTTGFNYFLLVYTPPPPPPLPSPSTSDENPNATDNNNNYNDNNKDKMGGISATADSSSPDESQRLPYRPHILGFFSKEKMSWDNNNLACILVFPPWQRKGLGALLMGVSYGISRREGVLGGPEKPISELGRKGYKRFWASEIARWLLDLDVPPPHPPPGQLGKAGAGLKHETAEDDDDDDDDDEMIIDIDDCSRATWIVPEDCMAVLREMGVAVEGPPGPGKEASERRRQQLGDGGDNEDGEDVSTGDHDPPPHHHHHNHNHHHGHKPADRAASSSTPGPGGGKHNPEPAVTSAETSLNGGKNGTANGTKEESNPDSNTAATTTLSNRRVRVDKAAVRAWLTSNKIRLDRACDPEGFMEGYALGGDGGSVPHGEEDDEEDEEDEEEIAASDDEDEDMDEEEV